MEVSQESLPRCLGAAALGGIVHASENSLLKELQKGFDRERLGRLDGRQHTVHDRQAASAQIFAHARSVGFHILRQVSFLALCPSRIKGFSNFADALVMRGSTEYAS